MRRHLPQTILVIANKKQIAMAGRGGGGPIGGGGTPGKGGTPPLDTRDNGDYDDDDYNILISVQGKGAKPEC